MNDQNQIDQGTTLQGVEHGFRILERIIDHQAVGVTELAEDLEVPKSTAHSYLTALTRAGYLVNEEGTYRPSFRVVEQAGHHLDSSRLLNVARPEVAKIAHKHGEAANLVIREGPYRVIIHQSESERSIHTSPLGDYAPLYQTAGGKAILAWLSKQRIESIIDLNGLTAATSKTITQPDELFDNLEYARDYGQAFERGEHIEGISGVAAPINIDQTPIGAVSLTGPRDRIYQNRQQLADSLAETTNIIEVEY